MRPHQSETTDRGKRAQRTNREEREEREDRAGPARRLRVVPPDGPVAGGADCHLDRLTTHIRLAHGLGLEPLTIDERAAAMLDAACDGWRFDRHCRDGDELLGTPHPLCLRAQYHHDVLLLEHGLLTTEGITHER